MSIAFDEKKKVFLLNTPHSTYVIRLFEGRVLHGGWVKKINSYSGICAMPMIDRAFAAVPADLHAKVDFSPDTVQWEFPVALRGDSRSPAIEAIGKDGTVEAELFYEAHRIYKGKKAIEGLPATYAKDDEADTLEIDLYDPESPLKVTLFYTVWADKDVICRHTLAKNTGKEPIDIKSIMSASVDFPHSAFSMLQLSGAHARERHVITRELVPGMQKVESRRTASSHQQNPFIALVEQGATEEHGDVYGFNLVYSGNFTAQTEVDQYGVSRVQLGINPFNFSWKLEEGETFSTPEVVMVYSQNGLGEMSRTYHDLYRTNLCRGDWKDKVRPIVINNWEATYFDFTSEKLFALAETAAKLGIELFVLDDGWFGKRNNDWTSLGDWFENSSKLPKGGLKEISDGIHERGLKFGLWFEPEMVSPDSDLYRAHPDWCLHCGERSRTLGRHQLVLDMSRSDVVDYLFEKLSAILSSCQIDYVKWDFNRSPSDVGSALLGKDRQQEVSHRFYLGLYNLLERLTQKFPHILFESCSGGGGRYDPAMLYYMPQTWTSDNTDALSRLYIQEGTSIAYPASSMSCHVSAVPNHQVGRVTSLSLRGHVAMAGAFGYELDLNKLSDLERAEIAEQVAWYKDIRHTAEYGDLYRLKSPKTTQAKDASVYAWESVEKDKSRALVTVAWAFSEANASYEILKLKGLDENATYRIKSLAGLSIKMLVRQFFPTAPDKQFCVLEDGTEISGAELMNLGLCIISQTNYGGSLHFKLERI